MKQFNRALLAVTVLGSGLIAACSGGTDLNPSAPVVINVGGGTTGGTSGGTTGGSTGSGVAGDPRTAALGTGSGTTVDGGKQLDPYSITTFFNNATFGNSTTVVGKIDNRGRPVTGTTGLAGSFTAPTVWPPSTAAELTASLALPTYVTSTSYIGAFEPGTTDSTAWTRNWTISVNGNLDVWKFYGALPTGTLSGKSVPVADGTCPSGTTLIGAFSGVIGALSNDEAKLFTSTQAAGDYDVCRLPARYTADGTLSLSNDNVYAIDESFPGTTIGAGSAARTSADFRLSASVLNIEPGTLIYATGKSALVIARGARINALGREDAPIIMTSKTQLQARFDGNSSTAVDTNSGEWAGLALLGQNKDSQCAGNPNFDSCDVLLEGNVGYYGGPSDNDSSGVLRYVIVRNSGNVIAEGNELNGITAGGVGRATEINYVQIHKNADDGIEFFGGNAFGAHMVFTDVEDDNIDGDNGWTGGVQFALIMQGANAANSGFELDGRFTRQPITFPLLANITVMSALNRPTSGPGAGDSIAHGALLREGLRFSINNTIFTGTWAQGCLNVNDGGISGSNPTPTNTFNRVTEAGGSVASGGPHFVLKNLIVDCATVNFKENDEGATR